MVRTKVGDRYVVEAMRANDYNLGGEQSGHVVCIDHATTGDGIIAALQFLLVMKEQQAKASELGETFTPYPQTLQNVRIEGVDADSVLALAVVKETIDLASQELGDNGRVLIRKSGTEPVIRVMVEAKDVKLRNQCLARIVDIIESHKADAA